MQAGTAPAPRAGARHAGGIAHAAQATGGLAGEHAAMGGAAGTGHGRGGGGERHRPRQCAQLARGFGNEVKVIRRGGAQARGVEAGGHAGGHGGAAMGRHGHAAIVRACLHLRRRGHGAALRHGQPVAGAGLAAGACHRGAAGRGRALQRDGAQGGQRGKRLSGAHEANVVVAATDAAVVGVAMVEIHEPGVARITGIGRTRPDARRQGIQKNLFVDRRILPAMLHQTLQLLAVGQTPIAVACKGVAFGMG